MPETTERPLTTAQVAAIFGVHGSTVWDWTNSGKLACFRTAGGHRRFHREDVERLLAETRQPNEAA